MRRRILGLRLHLRLRWDLRRASRHIVSAIADQNIYITLHLFPFLPALWGIHTLSQLFLPSYVQLMDQIDGE